MKIRQELSPAKRRIVSALTVALAVLVWFLLTLPVLPPNPAAVDQAEEPVAAAPADTTAPPPAEAPGSSAEPTDQAMADADGSGPAETAPQAPSDEPLTRDRREVQPAGPRPIVPASILPSPAAVIKSFAYLHAEEGLVRSAAMSFYRVTVSFFFAALVAIPVGILMGTYPPLRNAIEPFSSPLRYLPISAVTGIFIIVFGLGEEEKIAFLFTGTVVYLLPIVVESIQQVDDIYLETGYTLGAKPWQAIWYVLVPAAWPSIFEACRVIYGIGWTYVILAEVINAEYGLGHLIEISYKRGHIDWSYALVLVILLLGIGTNALFVLASRRLFAWKEAA
jgi:ABC-type nitrate/sulfonate/bicarbonate transport system permease component